MANLYSMLTNNLMSTTPMHATVPLNWLGLSSVSDFSLKLNVPSAFVYMAAISSAFHLYHQMRKFGNNLMTWV
jgi:hypothetical protein